MQYQVFIDPGIVNCCFLLYDNENSTVHDFFIKSVKDVSICYDILEKLLPVIKSIHVEKQVSKNTKCLKIEAAINTFCLCNKLIFELINARLKTVLLNIPKSTSYYNRKKKIVEFGTILLDNKTILYDNREKINNLEKKDDFFDCLLMAYYSNILNSEQNEKKKEKEEKKKEKEKNKKK